MNKVLADILDRPIPKGLSIPKVQTLIKEVAMLDTNSKLVYSASGEKIIKELDKYGVKDIPQNYRGVLLEHWLELLSQAQETVTEVPRPTGPNATTLTSDQLTDLGESAEKRAQQKATILAREKEAVARFKETGEKRYQDQQKAEALKEKQTQELLNQFFKAKVIVVPTEEIPQVQLTKENKEVLLATEIAAKEDPATTQKVFEEKIQSALINSEQEYRESIKEAEIKKTATHLVETLRNLPDHKSIDEIPDNPKSLNTLSIINPLSNPNSPEMIAMIPDKESREEFAKKVQALMLTAEGKRVVDLAGARAIFGEGGENLIYSLYGPDKITDFKISSDERDRDEGVEIDPQAVYEKGKQVYDFIKKVRQAKSAEEVTSTALAYYPTYTYSGVTTATKTVSTLTKALPAVGAVYGFRQGTLLAHWAKSGTPLLSAGNQNLVRLLTSQASVQEIASASLVTFSRPLIAFESGSVKVLLVTGTNKALGTQIAVGGVKFGQKMAGAIAVKGGTQVAVVTGTQAGAQLAVGTSTVLTKVLTFIGGLSSWATFGLSALGGYLLGKIIEKGPQIKKWFSENGWIFGVGAGVGGALLFGAGPGLGIGIVVTGAAVGFGTLATGAFGVLGLIGRSVGIAIATPVIVTLLVLPPLVAFIMLVINNSAYVVPPTPIGKNIIHIPSGGNMTKCDPEETGEDITEQLASSVIAGSVQLLPDSAASRQEGLCITPTMIVLHSSGGYDNDDGNIRTYETLVSRQAEASCQMATDTNDTIFMLSFFENKVENAWCQHDLNDGGVGIELAGEFKADSPDSSNHGAFSKCSPEGSLMFTPDGPHPCAPLEDLAFDAVCKVMQQYSIPWTQVFQHEDAKLSPKKDPIGDEWVNKFITRLKNNCTIKQNDEVR